MSPIRHRVSKPRWSVGSHIACNAGPSIRSPRWSVGRGPRCCQPRCVHLQDVNSLRTNNHVEGPLLRIREHHHGHQRKMETWLRPLAQFLCHQPAQRFLFACSQVCRCRWNEWRRESGRGLRRDKHRLCTCQCWHLVGASSGGAERICGHAVGQLVLHDRSNALAFRLSRLCWGVRRASMTPRGTRRR